MYISALNLFVKALYFFKYSVTNFLEADVKSLKLVSFLADETSWKLSNNIYPTTGA